MKNLFKIALLAVVAIAAGACKDNETGAEAQMKITPEECMVWFTVEDAETGEDLLDPTTEWNILHQTIKTAYQGREYPRSTIDNLTYGADTRTSQPMRFGLHWGEADGRYWLSFGDFYPRNGEGYIQTHFVIDWGDGRKNEIVVDCYVDEEQKPHRALWVDGVAQGEDWKIRLKRERVKPEDISDYHWGIISRHSEGMRLGAYWANYSAEVGRLVQQLITQTQSYDPAQVEAMLSSTHWEEAIYMTSKDIEGRALWSDHVLSISANWGVEDYVWSYHTFSPDGGYKGYFLPSDFGYWERIGELPEGRLPDEIVWNSVLTWSFAPEERSLTIHQLYEGQTAEESWQVLGIDSDILIISAPSARDAAVTRYYLYFPPEPER
uniref:hypothetical protein n=1 Tax=Alistipes sp. TaxID=1872444 RepID=UPI004057507B